MLYIHSHQKQLNNCWPNQDNRCFSLLTARVHHKDVVFLFWDLSRKSLSNSTWAFRILWALWTSTFHKRKRSVLSLILSREGKARLKAIIKIIQAFRMLNCLNLDLQYYWIWGLYSFYFILYIYKSWPSSPQGRDRPDSDNLVCSAIPPPTPEGSLCLVL